MTPTPFAFFYTVVLHFFVGCWHVHRDRERDRERERVLEYDGRPLDDPFRGAGPGGALSPVRPGQVQRASKASPRTCSVVNLQREHMVPKHASCRDVV